MGFAPIPAVIEPPKLLGPPTVVLIQRTLDNPVDAHNHLISSVSVSLFPRQRAFHPSRRYEQGRTKHVKNMNNHFKSLDYSHYHYIIMNKH
jgi:hypothetical protein